MTRPTGAPAADHAHLCNHAPGVPGDTQGCPRWPACLRPDLGQRAIALHSDITAAEVAEFAEHWREASLRMVADAFAVPVEFVAPVQPRRARPSWRERIALFFGYGRTWGRGAR